MKRIMSLLVFVFSIVCILQPTKASAEDASGSAVIPYYQGSMDTGMYVTTGLLTVSNITDSPITVTITLYDHNGDIVTDTADPSSSAGHLKLAGSSASVTNWIDNAAGPDYSVSFTLGGHNTLRLSISSETTSLGYGRIQWYQSNSSATHGLTAHSRVWVYHDLGTKISNSMDSISVNGGMPF